MNILTFVLVAWLAIVALVWCLIEGRAALADRRKAQKMVQEAEKAKAERALKMLTIAGLHKNAHIRYRRHATTHRLTRTS